MRRLFAVASAFSLILFLSAAVADVASRLTTFGWTSNHHHWSKGLFERAATTHNHYLIASKGILYDMGEESSDQLLAGRTLGPLRTSDVGRAALAKERAALALRAPVRHPANMVAVHIFS